MLVRKLLQDLSSKFKSFVYLRGDLDDPRDIDCVLSIDDFITFNNLYKTNINNYNGKRANAVFVSLNYKGINIVLDIHLNFKTHGVSYYSDDFYYLNTTNIEGIRCLNNIASFFHSLSIVIFINKFKKNKNFETKFSNIDKSLLNLKERWIFNHLRDKPLKLPIYLIIILLFYPNLFIHWILYKFERRGKIGLLIKLSEYNIIDLLKNLGIDYNDLSFINTKDDELRFAVSGTDLNQAFSYVSMSNNGIIIKKHISGLLSFFKISKLIYQNIVFEGYKSNKRQLLSVFFGTHSIDKSQLIKYSKGTSNYLIKFGEFVKNESVSMDLYRLIGLSLAPPKHKLRSGDKLIQQYIEPKPISFDNFLISFEFSEYIHRQFSDSKLGNVNTLTRKQFYFKSNEFITFQKFKYDKIDSNINEVPLSWAHCDLTLWNIINESSISGKFKYHIIDFEKFKPTDVPAGYDFCHYVCSYHIFYNIELTDKDYYYYFELFNEVLSSLNFKISLDYYNFLISEVVINYMIIADSSSKFLTQYNWLNSFAVKTKEIINAT